MKPIGTIPICQITYQVFEVPHKKMESISGGVDAFGYVNHEKQEIYILAGMTQEARRSTARHEAMHGVMTLSGASRALQQGRISIDELEEDVVRAVEPWIDAVVMAVRDLA